MISKWCPLPNHSGFYIMEEVKETETHRDYFKGLYFDNLSGVIIVVRCTAIFKSNVKEIIDIPEHIQKIFNYNPFIEIDAIKNKNEIIYITNPLFDDGRKHFNDMIEGKIT